MTNHKGLECDLCPAKAGCFFTELKGAAFQEFRDSRIANRYRKRQVVFYEGHQPHGVFVVCAGRVKVYKADGKGHQLTVRIAGPGSILGYRSLLAGEAYAATAEALDEASLAYVDEPRFRAFLEKNPAVAARMFRHLAKDIRKAEDKARDMAMKSSRERLADQLLAVGAGATGRDKATGSVRLPYTRQDLAELAGLAQETVIRLLTELEEQKVIAMDGRQLRILNGPALARQAGAAA